MSKCQKNIDGEKPGKIFPIDTLLVLEGSAEKGKCVSLSATHRGLGVIHYWYNFLFHRTILDSVSQNQFRGEIEDWNMCDQL